MLSMRKSLRWSLPVALTRKSWHTSLYKLSKRRLPLGGGGTLRHKVPSSLHHLAKSDPPDPGPWGKLMETERSNTTCHKPARLSANRVSLHSVVDMSERQRAQVRSVLFAR